MQKTDLRKLRREQQTKDLTNIQTDYSMRVIKVMDDISYHNGRAHENQPNKIYELQTEERI